MFDELCSHVPALKRHQLKVTHTSRLAQRKLCFVRCTHQE